MNRQNKAASSLLLIIIVVVAVIVVGAAMYIAGQTPAAATNPVTVYIDDVEQTGNYTEPQALIWQTDAITGWMYSKNFTVVNNMEENVHVTLITAGPSTLTWALNDTAIAPSDSAAAPLQVTDYQQGTYTWTLQTSNVITPTPSATPTPSPTPTPTPEPNTLEYTINWHEGVDNITVTVKTNTPYVIYGDEEQPKTYLFTAGEKITFEAKVALGYEWVRWEFSDGTSPVGDAKLSVTRTGNFTVTAVAKLIP